MFKSIGGYFEKKKILLNKDQNKSLEIKDGIKDFLEKEFGQNLKGITFVINYNTQENIISITAGHKVLANELAGRLVELNDFLKGRRINVNRILIR